MNKFIIFQRCAGYFLLIIIFIIHYYIRLYLLLVLQLNITQIFNHYFSLLYLVIFIFFFVPRLILLASPPCSHYFPHGFPRCWNIILLAYTRTSRYIYTSGSRKEEWKKKGKRSGEVSNGTLGVLPTTTFNS